MWLIESLIYQYYINLPIEWTSPKNQTGDVCEHYGRAWDMVQYWRGLKVFGLIWILAIMIVWMDVNAVRFI